MDQVDSDGAEESNSKADLAVIPPNPPHPNQEQHSEEGDTPTGKSSDPDGATKGYWQKLLSEKPDRHIELLLTLIIGFFAAVQLIVSCNNNDSTTQQTSQLIRSSEIGALAAKQNAQAARDFSASARSINEGIYSAVGQLGMQANNTQQLAANALQQTDATLALAEEAGRQADAAKVQSQAAIDLTAQTKSIANAAQQQLNSSERPWMKVNVEFKAMEPDPSPLFIDSNGLNVDILVEGKNVGASPATHVFTRTELTPSNNRPFIERRQQELCDSMHNLSLSIDMNMGEGDTVFPGDLYIFAQHIVMGKLTIDQELLKPSNRRFRNESGSISQIAGNDRSFDGPAIGAVEELGFLPFPSVYIVGCVDYIVDFTGLRHQTPFYYELQGIDLRKGSAKNVTIVKNQWWGNSAN